MLITSSRILVPALLALATNTAPANSEGAGVAGVAGVAGEGLTDKELMTLGRQIFTEISDPQCAICHTLADAGSSGAVGPDLDDLAPDALRVRAAVAQGVGVMPPYADLLTEEQIEAVSIYVSAVAGGSAGTP